MVARAEIRASGVGLVQTRQMTWLAPLASASGASIGPVTLAYETYGTLTPARDNAILLLHALSGDAHAAGRHSHSDRRAGWWDAMVGPGLPFDTDRYFIICSNVLGGCSGSTGPASINPATGRPYSVDFPVITIGDMVNAQVRLIDALGIDQLHAVAGGSMGGFQALEWATAHPARVARTILLATCAQSSVQNVAWNAIGRRAILQDPHWNGGDYYGRTPPADGLAVARMIGHITYLSEPALAAKCPRPAGPAFTLAQEFAIEGYLEHQGEVFNARFDANSYLYITKAIDYWDLPARYGSLDAALARSTCPFLVLAYSSDQLYTVADSRAIADSLCWLGRPVRHVEFATDAGHDAFLIESAPHAPVISRFLATSSESSALA